MEWILAKEKLPEVNEKWGESDYVLVYHNPTSDQGVAWNNSKMKRWYLSHSLTPSLPINVTHWMPLPEPPK